MAEFQLLEYHKSSSPGSSMVQATDAKEVGVENPAEKTFSHLNRGSIWQLSHALQASVPALWSKTSPIQKPAEIFFCFARRPDRLGAEQQACACVINQGTISADRGGPITINAQTFTNLGTTNELNGGRLIIGL